VIEIVDLQAVLGLDSNEIVLHTYDESSGYQTIIRLDLDSGSRLESKEYLARTSAPYMFAIMPNGLIFRRDST